MAVTVDNTVARVSNDGGTSVTTGSFDVGASDGLVVCSNCDTADNTVNVTWTISDNQAPDLTYVVINERDGSDGSGGGVINYAVVNPGSITGLTITMAVDAFADSPSLKVYKVTGHDTADMVGAISEADLVSSPTTTTAITSETAGAFFLNVTDWDVGTLSSTDTTEDAFVTTGDIGGMAGFKAIASASESVTGNITCTGTVDGNWTVFEIRAAASGDASFPLLYDYGHEPATQIWQWDGVS